MYVLMALLCAAMAVFISSCFVYASKFRRQKYPVHTTSLAASQPLSSSQPQQPHMASIQRHQAENPKTSVQNAHDWIWLGKSTLDPAIDGGCCAETTSRSHPVASAASQHLQQPHRFSASEVNVISNPLRTAVDDLHQAWITLFPVD